MEKLRKTIKDSEIYSSDKSLRELMIRLNKCEDQLVFTDIIKEGIIDEADVGNDSELLEKSSVLCKTEKYVNTMFNTEIKIEKDLIEDYKFEGDTSTISHTPEFMACMNLDNKSNLLGKSFNHDICKESYYSENFEEKPYKCNTCDKGIFFDSDLKAHTQTSANNSCFKYKNCSETFSLESSTNVNMGTDTEENQYKCVICEKSYSVLSVLKRHLRTHTGIRTYKCDNCDKAFYRSDILKQHTFIHTKKKPYKCEICDKGFTQLSNLKKHKFTHVKKRSYTFNEYL